MTCLEQKEKTVWRSVRQLLTGLYRWHIHGTSVEAAGAWQDGGVATWSTTSTPDDSRLRRASPMWAVLDLAHADLKLIGRCLRSKKIRLPHTSRTSRQLGPPLGSIGSSSRAQSDPPASDTAVTFAIVHTQFEVFGASVRCCCQSWKAAAIDAATDDTAFAYVCLSWRNAAACSHMGLIVISVSL